MKTKVESEVLTSDLRNKLKELMRDELNQLPELLKGVDPVQRLNILCKIMPFIMPKVEAVSPDEGEPTRW